MGIQPNVYLCSFTQCENSFKEMGYIKLPSATLKNKCILTFLLQLKILTETLQILNLPIVHLKKIKETKAPVYILSVVTLHRHCKPNQTIWDKEKPLAQRGDSKLCCTIPHTSGEDNIFILFIERLSQTSCLIKCSFYSIKAILFATPFRFLLRSGIGSYYKNIEFCFMRIIYCQIVSILRRYY